MTFVYRTASRSPSRASRSRWQMSWRPFRRGPLLLLLLLLLMMMHIISFRTPFFQYLRRARYLPCPTLPLCVVRNTNIVIACDPTRVASKLGLVSFPSVEPAHQISLSVNTWTKSPCPHLRLFRMSVLDIASVITCMYSPCHTPHAASPRPFSALPEKNKIILNRGDIPYGGVIRDDRIGCLELI